MNNYRIREDINGLGKSMFWVEVEIDRQRPYWEQLESFDSIDDARKSIDCRRGKDKEEDLKRVVRSIIHEVE